MARGGHPLTARGGVLRGTLRARGSANTRGTVLAPLQPLSSLLLLLLLPSLSWRNLSFASGRAPDVYQGGLSLRHAEPEEGATGSLSVMLGCQG